MISSFLIAFLGYGAMAVVSILDKFILTGEVKKPSIYAFYSTVLFFVLFILFPGTSAVNSKDLIWIIVSGLSFGFGIWTMFIALKEGEASHITPFIGATVAISTFLLSNIVLHEEIGFLSEIGIFILISTTFLLSYEKSKKHNGFHRGFIWALLSGVLFALSHVSAKYIYSLYSFFTALMWTKGTVGLVGIIALFFPGVWKDLTRKNVNKAKSPKNKISLILSSKVLGAVALVLVQYAISIGSVTIVNALAGIQYALMFVFIYLLTKLHPKLFKEYFTKRELLVETTSIVLMIIGLILLS